MKIETSAANDLVINRIFDAPRAIVFQMWTDPEHAKSWWGCDEFRARRMEMDVRPGGAWRSYLQSKSGDELRLGGEFREVIKPEKLVFTFAWDKSNEAGPGGGETLVTVTFVEQNGKTLMNFRHSRFESVELRDNHQLGWASGFKRLDEQFSQLKELQPV
jgi:uncharacterized protein YndB with AHSA1/START domain